MSTIFISHSSKDHKVASAICAALESRGLKCWIASRDVGAGDNFQESIVRAIRSAKVMVLVFTDNANNSTEIKKELALASQNKLAVIPARVEDVVPTAALAYELATRQWINLFQDWESEIETLCARVRQIVPPAATATSQSQPAAQPPSPPAAETASPPAVAATAAKPVAPAKPKAAARGPVVACGDPHDFWAGAARAVVDIHCFRDPRPEMAADRLPAGRRSAYRRLRDRRCRHPAHGGGPMGERDHNRRLHRSPSP